ncbi:MAG: PAS domain S-box protein, partial [Gemmatimonadetes bacterium]|nr:PAS domain S-box protein [Gemmatimonadota bacterium]
LILVIAVVASLVSRELGRRAALTEEIARLYDEARERGETYRLLFDDNPHPMWVYDRETFRLIATNDTASRRFGYSPAEFLGMTLYDLHLPEDHPALRRHLERATGETVSTWRMRRKDGTLVDVEVDARPTIYDGKPARIALIHDITERVRAAEMLRRSEEHFRALIERASDIITILEADGTIRYESPSAERVVGYRPDELVGRNVFEFIHPEDHGRAREELAKLLGKAAPVVVRLRFRHKDGGWRVLEATGSNLLENPAVHGIVVNTRDVTDRVRGEEQERELIREHAARAAAEEAQRRVEEILESITDGFFAFDVDWRITYVNHRAELLLGRSREALLGEDFWGLYPSLRHTPMHAEFQQALVERRSADAEFPSSVIRGKWYYLHFSPTRSGAVVYARDVSRRKRAEDENRFQARLLNAIGQAVIATDPSGAITYWNHAAEQLYGWTAAEVIGRPVLDVISSEARKAQAREIVDRLSAGRPWSGEFTVRRRDGTEFPAWVSDTPVLDATGAVQAIIGISFDITERKQEEELLYRERRRLAEAQRVAHLGSWEWDLETNAVSWSDEHFRLWGYEPQNFVPTCEAVRASTHPDDRARVADATQAAIRFPGPFQHEYRIVRPDGEVRVMDSRGEVITNGAGEAVRVVGTSQDITERKRQEAALHRTTAALDASMDGICVIASNGLFEYVNQAKARTFGYDSPDQLVGQSWRTLYPPGEVLRI